MKIRRKKKNNNIQIKTIPNSYHSLLIDEKRRRSQDIASLFLNDYFKV